MEPTESRGSEVVDGDPFHEVHLDLADKLGCVSAVQGKVLSRVTPNIKGSELIAKELDLGLRGSVDDDEKSHKDLGSNAIFQGQLLFEVLAKGSRAGVEDGFTGPEEIGTVIRAQRSAGVNSRGDAVGQKGRAPGVNTGLVNHTGFLKKLDDAEIGASDVKDAIHAAFDDELFQGTDGFGYSVAIGLVGKGEPKLGTITESQLALVLDGMHGGMVLVDVDVEGTHAIVAVRVVALAS